jgi:serpin B
MKPLLLYLALVQGNNTFALDLYSHLHTKEGNLFFSPYSISTALAMTYAGARGQTAAQMAKVLHFPLDPQRLPPAFAQLIGDLNGHGAARDYQLNVAQSLWGDTGLQVQPEFQKLLQTDYGASMQLVNFLRQPEEARQQINRWVEERTNDKIKDLLHAGDIDPRTRMVLVNAIYFKAAWDHPFQKNATQKDIAFHAPGKEVQVAMMHQTEHFKYAEDATVQVLELPYKGEKLSMLIFLPRERQGLGKVGQSLTRATLDGWLGKLAPRRVQVELPRFKVNDRFELGQQLGAMGMPLAFSQEADFSGINTSEKLSISKVVHQAFVDVNEEGTEAAAATGVGIRMLALPPSGPPVTFRADHPFLFLLRDHQTGSILFLGQVMDPSK